MQLNTHFQGKITELQVAEAFLKRGIAVSQPLVADSRYDFILDINHNLIRLQVKTCREGPNKDYITFATSSSHTNTKGTINHSYSSTEIDYFATIYDGVCYVIAVKDCGRREQRLRFTTPLRNNQHQSKMAENYTIDKFLAKF